MEGIGMLILFCYSITFGPPLIFFVIGLVKRKSDPSAAKLFFIFATIWFIIGGGICASIMMG